MIKLGLDHTDLMPQGRYRGIPMKDIPKEYLITFHDKVPRTRFNKDIHEYVEDHILKK